MSGGVLLKAAVGGAMRVATGSTAECATGEERVGALVFLRSFDQKSGGNSELRELADRWQEIAVERRPGLAMDQGEALAPDVVPDQETPSWSEPARERRERLLEIREMRRRVEAEQDVDRPRGHVGCERVSAEPAEARIRMAGTGDVDHGLGEIDRQHPARGTEPVQQRAKDNPGSATDVDDGSAG